MSRIIYSHLAFLLLVSGCRPALTPTNAAPSSAWSAGVRKHNRDLGSQAEHSTPVDWQIGQSKEPVTFWLEVANSPKYGIDTRRVCILELFRRHVSAGMSLGDVGKMLVPDRVANTAIKQIGFIEYN